MWSAQELVFRNTAIRKNHVAEIWIVCRQLLIFQVQKLLQVGRFVRVAAKSWLLHWVPCLDTNSLNFCFLFFCLRQFAWGFRHLHLTRQDDTKQCIITAAGLPHASDHWVMCLSKLLVPFLHALQSTCKNSCINGALDLPIEWPWGHVTCCHVPFLDLSGESVFATSETLLKKIEKTEKVCCDEKSNAGLQCYLNGTIEICQVAFPVVISTTALKQSVFATLSLLISAVSTAVSCAL